MSEQQHQIVQAKAARMAEQAYQTALEVHIDSPEMLALAGTELQAIKGRYNEIEELRLSLTRPLDETKRRIMDLFRAPQERLKQAEDLIRRAVLTYQQEEREQAERARLAAEEAARVEREQAAIAQRQAEEEARRAREAADKAMTSGDTEAVATALMRTAEADAKVETAAFVAEMAVVAPVTLPASATTTKVTGISTRQTWKAEVRDLAALVTAAAEGIAKGDTTLLAYLQANDRALGMAAKALKGQARIPGVRVYAEEGLSVRQRA